MSICTLHSNWKILCLIKFRILKINLSLKTLYKFKKKLRNFQEGFFLKTNLLDFNNANLIHKLLKLPISKDLLTKT